MLSCILLAWHPVSPEAVPLPGICCTICCVRATQFQEMDSKPEMWLPAPAPTSAVPHFMRFDTADVREAVTANSKLRPDQVPLPVVQ